MNRARSPSWMVALLVVVGCGPASTPTSTGPRVGDERPVADASPPTVDDGALELGGALAAEVDALAGRCDGGEAAACEQAVLADELGRLGPERARALLTRGCELGDPLACWRAERVDEAIEKARAACQDGAGECFALGLLEAKLGSGEDERSMGRARIVTACEKGLARACFTAATFYEDGAGFDRNLALALDLYEKACEGGHADACNNASTVLHDRGQDEDSCARSRRACELGHARSCGNAGVCDEDARRFAEAAILYRKACGRGDALGCYNLGHLYRRADGVPRDRRIGVYLLELACRGGYDPGCNDAQVLAREPE